MKKKNIIVLCMTAALVIVLGAFLVIRQMPQQKLVRKLAEGNRYMRSLDYENAILAYEAAVEIDQNSIDAYEGLGTAYVSQAAYLDEDETDQIIHMYENAENSFEMLTKMEPENAERYVALADVYVSHADCVGGSDENAAGDLYKKAHETYEMALEKDKNNTAASEKIDKLLTKRIAYAYIKGDTKKEGAEEKQKTVDAPENQDNTDTETEPEETVVPDEPVDPQEETTPEPTPSPTEEPAEEAFDLYREYANKIAELEAQHGGCGQDDSGLNGLCFMKLVDFAHNGQEQLVVAYKIEPQGSLYYNVEIWGAGNGEIVLLASTGVFHMNGGAMQRVIFTETNGQTYLVSGSEGGGSGSSGYYGFQGDAFTEVHTSNWDSIGNAAINGQAVSDQEESQDRQNWFVSPVEYVIGGDYNNDYSAALNQNAETRQRLAM
ncbi:MAG: tetratricopeptide repeat protein [Eubacteriales bacterium]|nr:tetratricopeptide repeat protein [Eubacteriales bacterium]